MIMVGQKKSGSVMGDSFVFLSYRGIPTKGNAPAAQDRPGFVRQQTENRSEGGSPTPKDNR